jgi:hypothetical protein
MEVLNMLIRLYAQSLVNYGSSNPYNSQIKIKVEPMPEPIEADAALKAMFDQVAISLQASAAERKAQNPALHGGYTTYEGINWDLVNTVFTYTLRKDVNDSVSGEATYDAEVSIEVLAAEYALTYYYITSSNMSDDDKSMAMDHLNSILEKTKLTLGTVLQKQLSDFLAKGGVKNSYSDISEAIGQIVDNRIEEYKTLTDVFVQMSNTKRPGGCSNAADYLVMLMYSDKYIDIQKQGDSVDISGKYTYAEIKAAFKAISRLNSHLDSYGDSGSYLYTQGDTALIAGFATLYYSAITEGVNSKSGLLSAIEKSMYKQLKDGAEKWGKQLNSYYAKLGHTETYFSVDYVMSYARQFSNLIQQQNFNANMLNLLLKMRSGMSGYWLDQFDMTSPDKINVWNEWIKVNKEIDTKKYTIAYEGVA